jgi:hypothetical protein
MMETCGLIDRDHTRHINHYLDTDDESDEGCEQAKTNVLVTCGMNLFGTRHFEIDQKENKGLCDTEE